MQRPLVVAVLVGDDNAHRADHVAGTIVQLQFAFKTLAGGVDLQIRFAGEDAAHVIVIGFLAEAPDV